MKKIFYLSLFLSLPTILFAQDEEQYLFKSSFYEDWNALLETGYTYGSVADDHAHTIQHKLGIQKRNSFAIGGFYQYSINNIRPQTEMNSENYLDYSSVGLFTEVTLLSNRVVHASFPLLLGFGEVQLDNEEGDLNLGEDNFLLIEPSARVQLNLDKFVQLYAGAGYAFHSGVNYRSLNNSDLNGFRLQVGLRLRIPFKR